jgi:hypothetical protein
MGASVFQDGRDIQEDPVLSKPLWSFFWRHWVSVCASRFRLSTAVWFAMLHQRIQAPDIRAGQAIAFHYFFRGWKRSSNYETAAAHVTRASCPYDYTRSLFGRNTKNW